MQSRKIERTVWVQALQLQVRLSPTINQSTLQLKDWADKRVGLGVVDVPGGGQKPEFSTLTLSSIGEEVKYLVSYDNWLW